MKKLLILLSCVIIIGSAPLNAMKRNQDQVTAEPEPAQPLWLPDDLITKIAAICDPESQANLSMTSRSFDKYASIKNNQTIINQPEFEIKKDNRLFYLFYGCLHNLKNLVNKALQTFDLEKKENDWRNEECYPDKQILHEAKYQIDQCIKTDACKLLPHYSDMVRSRSNATIFDLAGSNNDAQLFNLCIKNPQFNHLNAIPSWIVGSLMPGSAQFKQNTDDDFTKATLAMLKILLMHKRYSAHQLCSYYENGDPFQLTLWSTPSLTAAKLFLDYDTVNDINRRGYDTDYPETLLHTYIGLPNTIKLLLTHPKIDVNIQDREGRTALHRAADVDNNNLETTKLLLAHPKIDVNLQDSKGNTPLHMAIENYKDESVEIIKLLLAEPRMDVNLQNNEGNTPLHSAAKSEDLDKIELLLAHPKINISILNKEGISPTQCMINTEESSIDDFDNKKI